MSEVRGLETRDLPWAPAAASAGSGTAEDGDGLTLSGYAARFNQPVLIPDQGQPGGGFEEVIRRGAFTRSLRQSTPVLMFEHGRHPLVGTLPIGRINVAEEDDKGLWISARLLASWAVQPVREAIAMGAVRGMSIRFSVADDGERWTQRRSALDLRELTDVNLAELGPVVFPAYPSTSVAVRSPGAQKATDHAKLLRLGIVKPMRRRDRDTEQLRVRGILTEAA